MITLYLYLTLAAGGVAVDTFDTYDNFADCERAAKQELRKRDGDDRFKLVEYLCFTNVKQPA